MRRRCLSISHTTTFPRHFASPPPSPLLFPCSPACQRQQKEPAPPPAAAPPPLPPAMAHPFLGAKADVNCVGHGGRVLVCVSGSGGWAGGCFVCDVATNRWEELPRCDGEAAEFVAAVSFEPRMEARV
jgi:hypothetical protein